MLDKFLQVIEEEMALTKLDMLIQSLSQTVTDLFQVEVAESRRHFFGI